MSDVIEKYVCYVIFEKKNEVGVLPHVRLAPRYPVLDASHKAHRADSRFAPIFFVIDAMLLRECC